MNFTSALYLGITHDSENLKWTQLTTGTPAAVQQAAQAREVARAFAALVGCGGALALRSTLHAFGDLFGQIARAPATVVHDAGVYPIARWGMGRIEQCGGRVRPFRHHDADALAERLREMRRGEGRTSSLWVVSDGFCPGCGEPAPLAAYAQLAGRYGGRLLIDDTQSLGIFGRAPTVTAAWGRGGGGSVPRWQLGEHNWVLIASLAKGFGAPLAMLAGTGAFVDEFSASSETLVHCSPPSAADLAAAARGLLINAREGDERRARLLTRVRTLRRLLRARGFAVRGGLFPVQRVPLPDDIGMAIALQARLARDNVQVVLQRSRCTQDLSLTFIVTARHDEAELRHAADALAAAARGCRGFDTASIPTLEA